MRRSFILAGSLTLAAGVLPAQSRARVYSSYSSSDRDRPAIGVTTSSGSKKDTLGLLVSSVTAGGPADKAGIEEGNRLISINGVNLRLSAADAGEDDMDDIANRRLIRELGKMKAGDDADFRVYAGGQTKSVKVKTVALEDLPSRTRSVRRELEDRPVVGLSLSATGSKRDTLGMLVVRVTTDGPAEKAGIVEGDRVSAINGVSLRVAAEDAGDGYMSSARMNRYRRELAKVNVGEDVELRVLSNGQTKSVRIKPVRAGDLPRDRAGVMIIGDGAVSIGDMFPALPTISIPPTSPTPRAAPAPRIFEFDGNWNDGIRMRIDPRARIEIQERANEAAERAREATRDMMERLDRMRYEIDRRADERTETLRATPAPRARGGNRIARAEAPSAGSAYSYGYATGSGSNDIAVAATPNVDVVTSAAPAAVAAIPVVANGSVAVWSGDDATFTLQGLRLARVNDGLADNLGTGSDRGFLILDAGQRWSGLRAGDVLLEVDGRAVRNGDGAIIRLNDSESHTAKVIRDGQHRQVAVDVR
jgi:S1-C subfamily serine protease